MKQWEDAQKKKELKHRFLTKVFGANYKRYEVAKNNKRKRAKSNRDKNKYKSKAQKPRGVKRIENPPKKLRHITHNTLYTFSDINNKIRSGKSSKKTVFISPSGEEIPPGKYVALNVENWKIEKGGLTRDTMILEITATKEFRKIIEGSKNTKNHKLDVEFYDY